MQLSLPFRATSNDKPKPLKPAGYNKAAESLVQPIILLGSTILSIIAAYVLAESQVLAVFSGTASPKDLLVLMLVAGLGIMVDTAMVISASRFRMHIARGRRDWPWAVITGLMLALCLSVESMTLLYFGYLVAPASLPPNVVETVKGIHDILFFVRNGMPPLILIFFSTALLPLTIEPADRDRATKASTSLNISALEEDLVQIGETVTREAKVQALADQLALFEHASHASPAEHERNAALIKQLQSQTTVLPVANGATKTDVQTMIAEAMRTELHPVWDWMNVMETRLVEMTSQLERAVLGSGPQPVVQMNSVGTPSASAAVAAPTPGTQKYNAFVLKQINLVNSLNQVPTAQRVADTAQLKPSDVRQAFIALQEAGKLPRQVPASELAQ